ncbi:MAG: hypothetical protein WC595_00275 [Candidatus Nanoarchaeia archaeon]
MANEELFITREKLLFFYSTSKVNQQLNALNYYKAIKLKKYTDYNCRQIAEKIDMPYSAVYYWLQGFAPKSVKGLNELEAMNLLPLKINNSSSFLHFICTFGIRFADGCIYEQKRNNSFTFYLCFGDKLNAQNFVYDCEKHWSRSFSINFGSNAYYVYLPASLARLYIVAGSPIGDKTDQVFQLPAWIHKLSDSLKFEFLNGLFSGDASTPKLKPSGVASETIKLSLSAEKAIVEEFSQSFMLDIWKLLDGLSIDASKPKVQYNQPRIAKDGRVTYPVTVNIRSNRKNMVKFLNNVNYRYNHKGNARIPIMLESLK